MPAKNLIALDVGEKRIGVATATASIKIAIPLATLDNDGTEVAEIARIIADDNIDTIVIGYPRNQSGEATAQTAFSEEFAKKLQGMAAIVFQDESVTSITAEAQLKATGKPYTKGDIDARAAAIILQDYLELH